MSPLVYGFLKLAHILFIATWFGAGLTYASDVRRTLEKGPPHTHLLAARVGKSMAILAGSGAMAIATGLVLVFSLGGFASIPPRIHAGLGLTLILFAVQAAVLRPTWGRIASLLDTPSGLDEARKLAGRLGMLSGIGHLLWLVVLALMVVPFGG
jgi:hypothetical protein